MTAGKAPSMFQMSKLFLNAEVREAAQDLVEEFKKAGVDLNTKVNAFNIEAAYMVTPNLKRSRSSDSISY